MTKTEQKVIKFIDEKKLITEGDRILIALSGGPDSVFLATLLNKFKKRFRIQTGAFHLNHMLRDTADNDELFCSELCTRLNIPFHSRKEDIKTLAREKKISIEEAGRNARYTILAETADLHSYNKIATGHNAGDNTETMLLNLVKGAGLRGLAGIPYSRGNIIRPLLNISKNEILEQLEKWGAVYRTDASNLTDDYERNFIRNRIIPLIVGKLNPSLDNSFYRSSEIFKTIAEFIDKKASESKVFSLKNGEILINENILMSNEPELIPEILRSVIERNFPVQLTFNDVSSVMSLLKNKTGRSADLTGKLTVSKERAFLRIHRKKPSSNTEFRILPGSHYSLGDKELTITVWEEKVNFTEEKNVEFISGDEIAGELIVRSWKAGDRFNPFGMKGTVKVSDFLNSLKIPSSEKKEKLVLTDEKNIIWVIGYRINEIFKIKPETRKILKLCLK